MKKLHFFIPLTLLFFSSATTFAQNANRVETGVTTKQLQRNSAIDRILSVSHSAKANVIIDSTSLSVSGEDVSLQAEDDVRGKLLDIAYVDRLSLRQIDNRTFLLWSEPDTTALIKTLIADNGRVSQHAVSAQPESDIFGDLFPDVDNQRVGILIADYLQRKYTWDGQSASINVEFKLSEMPTESATALLHVAHVKTDKANAQRQKSWLSDTAWLSDDLWRSARVGYFQTPSKEMVLAVRGTDGQRDYFMSLERLTTLSKVEWHPTEDKAAPQDNDKEIDEKLTPTSLQNEKSLASSVSFEAVDVPLKTLLDEMQKSAGVNFVSSPNLLLSKKVTASVSDMPLYSVMNALTQLYGIKWARKTNGDYVAAMGLSPSQIDALQLGDYQWFRYWAEPARRTVAPAELKLPELVNLKTALADAGIEEQQLLQPQGVELSTLPEKLRDLIRQNIEGDVSARMVAQYQSAFSDNSELPDQIGASMSIQVKPSTNRVIIGSGAQSINTAPPLNAALIVDGKEVYTFGVYGQQARQAIEAQIQQYENLQEKMKTQGQEGDQPN